MRAFAIAGVALLASACAGSMNRVDLGDAPVVVAGKAPALACAYRLGGIADARPNGDHAGQLGVHLLNLDDAPATIRESLLASGFAAAEAPAPLLELRLMRFYMAQQYEVKIPVVVLEARIGAGAPFVVRSQSSSINWNGSEKEARAAVARAVGDSRLALVAALNARCPKPAAG